MKRFLIVSLIMMVAISFLSADIESFTPRGHSIDLNSLSARFDLSGKYDMPQGTNQNIREEAHYLQDFNDGWAEWTTWDRTFTGAMWHLTFFNAYGGTGYSWWMADPEIEGYYDGQYTYLNTPEILVTEENSTLTFKMDYKVEPLGDWVDPNDPTITFDGWDGINVRISTDGGQNWEVISGSPSYNSTSMFAFGRIHGEGPDVPGWAGSSDGWVDASFDLSAYIDTEVMIRFAFASDNAHSTVDNPELYSAFIDNISLGDFVQDFDDGQPHGMTYGSIVAEGGDLWHIGQPEQFPPSPPNAALCQNEQGTYNTNMYNYLISPPIELPPSGDIRVDFMVIGEFLENSQHFPNCNLWGVQITSDGGDNWYGINRPYGTPGNNLVFIDAPPVWFSFADAYGIDGVISELAGETVQFRIFFVTNDDDPEGFGLFIDNFTIYHDEYFARPVNLVASEDNRIVNLNWDPVGTGGEEGWIHWDNGENENAIGIGIGTFDVAVKFQPVDLEPYFGGYITKMNLFLNEDITVATYELKIWTGSRGDELLYEQPITNFTAEDWNEIELDEPIQIVVGETYWFGYTVDQLDEGFPAGLDAGPRVANKGDMVRIGPSWETLYPNFDANWNIQALVEILDDEQNIVTNILNNYRMEPNGYKVYRSTTSGSNYELIQTIENPLMTEATDLNPVLGMTNYYVVTAFYDDGESHNSNEANVFILRETAQEIIYDDGSVDSGYNVGSGNQFAVHFDPDTEETVQLTHIKIFVETRKSASYIVRVLADNEGVPGDLKAQFIYQGALIKEGWNVIPLPTANPIDLTGESFFIGFQEALNASSIGVDENNSGNSYVKIGAEAWEELEEGNFMVRAIIDSDYVSVHKELLPSVAKLRATNYPNPFNPETTIQFNLPETDNVNLSVYNLKGQLVTTLTNDVLSAGTHSVVWNGKDMNGRDIASGIYFYRVVTGTQTITNRMVLLK